MVFGKKKIEEPKVEEEQEIKEETKEVQQPQKEEKLRYDLVEVPLTTEVVFRDNSTGTLMDDKQMLLHLANKMEKWEHFITN
jgi:hypothetical protein